LILAQAGGRMSNSHKKEFLVFILAKTWCKKTMLDSLGELVLE
jgi:hypothetical protein